MFYQDLKNAVAKGFEAFQLYIQHRIEEDASYLERCYCDDSGQQRSILSWLVAHHPEQRDMIEFTYQTMQDPNVGAPVHQALHDGRVDLAIALLTLDQPDRKFDLFYHDGQRTLLSLILASKNKELTRFALTQYQPNPNKLSGNFKLPLHEAIIAGNSDAVRQLLQRDANPSTPCGDANNRFPPLVLAAMRGHYGCMSALMTHAKPDVNEHTITHKGAGQVTAMEVLCHKAMKKQAGMKGIAMLLCHHAALPANEDMRDMLCHQRHQLMTEIEKYLSKHLALIDAFVEQAYTKSTPLHQVLFPQHTLEHSWRRIMGRPDMDIACRMAILVINKYKHPDHQADTEAQQQLLKKAKFTQAYIENFRERSALSRNNRSAMVHAIEDGELDIVKAKDQAKAVKKQNTRTARVWASLFPPQQPEGGHQQLDVVDPHQPDAP